MQRALFIYAKLNPGVRYVQGMNELLSPLYYSFRGDTSQAQHAEADSFFCFVELVSECRDNFTQQLVRTWTVTYCCTRCACAASASCCVCSSVDTVQQAA